MCSERQEFHEPGFMTIVTSSGDQRSLARGHKLDTTHAHDVCYRARINMKKTPKHIINDGNPDESQTKHSVDEWVLYHPPPTANK